MLSQGEAHDNRSLAGNVDYPAEVSAAAREVWCGSGTFVFTSSSGIYAEKDGGVVNESSPLSDAPRAEKLKGERKMEVDGLW